MKLSRRHFLQTAGAVTLGFGGLHTLFAVNAQTTPSSSKIVEGFGPLTSDPEGILDLQDGFTYQVISRTGDRMDDGLLVPGKPDGMATFPGPKGRTILIRNHEVSPDDPELGPFGAQYELREKLATELLYDAGTGKMPCLGGTTTVVFNTDTGEIERQFVSLAGTIRNCAGGPTPWDSWLSCEETVQRAEDPLEKDHGYNFEVPARADVSVARPIALKEMGRFNHEAVAVDPQSGAVYETEDRDDGLIYRYLPNQPGDLAKGGRLQALCVCDRDSIDTRNWEQQLVPTDAPLDVRWIDVTDVESPNDDLRHRGFEAGAARFARGEGMWYGHNTIYFACTSGGAEKCGQIWKYTPSPVEGLPEESKQPGKLELFIEPNDGGIIDNADNLTVSPWGDLIVCEDGSWNQYLVGITPEGGIYKFARNAISDSELAGSTFSPDGTTLFVNIQHNGLTLAIRGPWRQRIA